MENIITVDVGLRVIELLICINNKAGTNRSIHIGKTFGTYKAITYLAGTYTQLTNRLHTAYRQITNSWHTLFAFVLLCPT